MYLIRVLSLIWDLRFSVRGEHVPDGWGREGEAWWLRAGDICTSQGTFSSIYSKDPPPLIFTCIGFNVVS